MIHSAKEFIELRNSSNPEEYYRATHETANEDIWLEVLKDYPEMTKWVIHNKTVPLSILRILAKSVDSDIRRDVARKRKLDNELFELLSQDEDEYVRGSLARNQKTPKYILEKLVADPSEYVAEIAKERLKKV